MSSESPRPLRVAVLSQWLSRDGRGVAGGLATALTRQGAEVELVAGMELREDWTVPRGTPRLRRFRQVLNGHRVTRYPFVASHGASAVGRLGMYGSFGVVTSFLAVSQLAKADVVLVNSTPATVAAAAMVARRLRDKPYVLLVQDVWPDSIFASGFLTSPRVRRLAEPPVARFVDASYARAEAVVGISPGMRRLLVERGVAPERAHYVYNWADEEALVGRVSPAERVPGQPLHLMYAGNLGYAQDLGNVLSALALVEQNLVKLSLVGHGAAEKELRQRATDLGLSNVEFIPRVPKSELRTLMASAHMHLLSLADEELFTITLPSKLQFMLAAGAPILSTAPGESSTVVRASRAGLVAPPGEPIVLAERVREAASMTNDQLDEMGNRAADFYSAEMSEAVNGARLYQILQKASGSKSVK